MSASKGNRGCYEHEAIGGSVSWDKENDRDMMFLLGYGIRGEIIQI